MQNRSVHLVIDAWKEKFAAEKGEKGKGKQDRLDSVECGDLRFVRGKKMSQPIRKL